MVQVEQNYRWACESTEHAEQIAINLHHAGLSVGVNGATVILPRNIELLQGALLSTDSPRIRLALEGIVFTLGRGKDAPVPYHHRTYEPVSNLTSDKSGIFRAVVASFRKYLA